MPAHPPPVPPAAADLPFSPAADRNKAPILEQLERLLPPAAQVLEIASGSGQHAAYFAARQSGWVWQPSEADPRMLAAIDARCAGLANVRPAIGLDLLHDDPVRGTAAGAPYAAVYCANLLHISPWATSPALMRVAAALLARGGRLLVYGPFVVEGVPTAASNLAFDADLKARDPRWGLRLLSQVHAEASRAGLVLRERVSMPANNLLVVFERGHPADATGAPR